MSFLLVALAIGQLLDGMTLAYIDMAMPSLLQHEQNGVVGFLIGSGGVWSVLLVKMVLVTAVVGLTLFTRGRVHGTSWRAAVAFVAFTGFVGAAFNFRAILG